MENEYIKCADQLPDERVIVATKIDNEKGCRNETLLWRQGGLWFVPDGSMYVYYSPTHWRPATVEELQKERMKFAADAVSANTRLAEIDAAIAEMKLTEGDGK